MRTQGAQNGVGQDDVLTVAGTCHARSFDDEIVILDLQAGDYFGVAAVGKAIWEGLAAGTTPAQVAAQLVASYDVEYTRALKDCLAFANELCARDLLRRR